MNFNDINKILASFSSTDIARLALPSQHDIEKLMFSNDLASSYNLMVKHIRESVEPQQKYTSDLASKMTGIAQALEKQYRLQINAFQSITQKLQPLIFQQTKLAHDLSKGCVTGDTLLGAMKTISSFHAFQIYQETFEEFGGGLNPDNITEAELEKTIEDNLELIQEVNEVVLRAESDGVSPGDFHELIYQYLVKKIPNLSKRTYSVIILIFTVIIFAYNFYSDYALDKRIDEIETTSNEKVVPKLEQNEETLKVQSEELNGLNEKLDSTNSALDNLHSDFEEYQEETESKLDLMLEEMQKQQNRTQK